MLSLKLFLLMIALTGLAGVEDRQAQTEQGYENLSSPVELLASYYNAINRREYERAWQYWETPPGAFAEFRRGYADTVSVQLIVQPPTVIHGAAGSLYVEVPTVLVARERDGSEHLYAGCYVARRSNLRAPDQIGQAWRIYKAHLKPAVRTVTISQLLAQTCGH